MKQKPSIKLKQIHISDKFLSLTFKPDGVVPRGVISTHMTVGGDFVVTIAVDLETKAEATKRIITSKQMVDAAVKSMTMT